LNKLDQAIATFPIQQRKQEPMPRGFFEIEAAKDRTGLLESSRENVKSAYTQAVDNDVDAPVVFVLDLRYEKAAMLAESCIKEKSEIQKMIDNCARKKIIPTVITTLSHDDAVEAMDSTIRDSGKILSSTIPRGYFRVMVLALGDFSHSACPIPETRRIDPY
jgi:hypothetical protein